MYLIVSTRQKSANTQQTHTLSRSNAMAPSGGPSTSLGGGVLALADLTEEVVRSWKRT